MFITELDTFVRKFHQLWNDGLTAHLDLDTHVGNAWVGLRVQLGQVPGPPHQQVQPFPQQVQRKAEVLHANGVVLDVQLQLLKSNLTLKL